jgi:N-acetylneuraminic acid mutarotase
LIFVAGGRPPRGGDFAVYNTASNQWTTLPALPTGRNHIAAAAIGGKVYVTGGRLGAGFTSPMTNVLEVYDPVANTWSTRAPMPTIRGGINGIAVSDRLFVWGGEGPDGMFDQHEMYIPALDRWYRLEPMPVAVHGVTGAAFINGWIHMPGGGTSTGGSSGSVIHQVFSVAGIVP